MLGTHSRCFATPESKFIAEVYLDCVRMLPKIDLMAAFDKVTQRQDFKAWELDVDSLDRSELSRFHTCSELISWLVRAYARSVDKPDVDIWIDHTPSNIFYASILFQLFPQARMIHIVRDGRSVAASVMKLDWGPNTINAAAYWWINRVAHGLAAESFFGSERIMRVRYEDLVLEPQSTLQALCSFLQIEYEPSMVTGTGFRMPKQIAHIHPFVGTVPNASRIYAWQNELTSRQVEIFESIGGQFLTCLGYELKFGPNARAAKGFELLGLGIQELYWQRLGNRFPGYAPERQVTRKPRRSNPIPVS